MKRKATAQSKPGPISAIAARRARQSQTVIEQPPAAVSNPQSVAEPPLKKPKAISGVKIQKTPRLKTKSAFSQTSIDQDLRASKSSPKTVDSDVEDTARAVERQLNNTIEENAGIRASSDEANSDESYESQISIRERYGDFLLSKTPLKKCDIVYKTKNSLCIRLKLKMTLAIVGQYDIWVKRGVVSIMGAKLHANPKLYRVYAPSTHSLPVIKCVSGIEDYAEVEITSCYDGLSRLKNVSNMYERIWNHRRSLPSIESADFDRPSFSLLHSSSDDPYNRHLRPLHLEKEWSTAIKHLSHSGVLRVLTCGPKGSGKSTFNKYLLNHLLSSPPSSDVRHPVRDGVAFLDLDPGQPEYSPMGHIYLAHLRSPNLGPPFSHPTLASSETGCIVRSHHIGSTSPKDDPDHYTSATMDLMSHYRTLLQSHPRCPLIINYPGWIFGQGLEIVTWFVKSLGLSNVVYMSERGPEEVVVPLRMAAHEAGIPLTILPSQPTEYTTRSSSQLRTMQMISYFHMKQDRSCKPTWSALPVSRHRAITVGYSESKPGIFGIMVTGAHQEPDHLYDLLDGSVVSVVAVEDSDSIVPPSPPKRAEVEEDKDLTNRMEDINRDTDVLMADSEPSISNQPQTILTRTTREKLPYIFMGSGTCTPLTPESSHSLGLGIVRSINVESQTLELVTPIPTTVIRDALERGHQIILVRGHLDNPNWALSEEYFATRLALKQHRETKTRAHKEDPASSHTRMGQEATAEKLRERTQRASRGPWMRTLDPDGGDITKASKKKENGLWKVRKLGYSAGSGSGSDQEW